MKKALLIGINYSDYNSNSIIKLNGCIDDIINIQNTLIKYYGYDSSNIIMLRDDSQEPSSLPTKENIIFHLKDIMSSKNDSVDEIWIHYSGHGSQIHNNIDTLKSNDVVDIIVPIDYAEAGFISDIELCDYIKNIEPNIPTVMVFDCCHSGSICNMPWSFEYNSMMQTREKDSKTVLSRTRIDSLNIPNQNVYVFSGCRDDQVSLDSFNKEYNQYMGVFTNALNRCLCEINVDLPIIILYKNICELMKTRRYKQNPILSSSSMEPKYKFVKNK
jgi:hypothetical protein